MNWVDYWSKPGFDDRFWQRSMQYYCTQIERHFSEKEKMCVLDYGAGPGFIGPYLAPSISELHMLEPSKELVEKALQLNKDFPNVHVSQIDGLPTTKAYIQGHQFDTILINSVLQYVKKADTPAVIKTLTDALSADGSLIISDIVPNKSLLVRELLSVAVFYFKWFSPVAFTRYVLAEVARLRMRSNLDLTTYTQEEFEAQLPDGLNLEWIPNPTVCRNRYCARITRR
jgi:2-polyprenyl-3-methyl-5-hydroxy-6-metoxy-1,4-benzoquinol methylase